VPTIHRVVALAASGILATAAALAPAQLPAAHAAAGPNGVDVRAGVVDDATGTILHPFFYNAGSGEPFLLAIDVRHQGAQDLRSVVLDTGLASRAHLTSGWSCTSPSTGITPVVWEASPWGPFVVLPETFDPVGTAALRPGDAFRCVTEVTLDALHASDYQISPAPVIYTAPAGSTVSPPADGEGVRQLITGGHLQADGGYDFFRAIAGSVAVTKWVEIGGQQVTAPTAVEPGTYTVGWEMRNAGPAANAILRIEDVTVAGVPIDVSTLACADQSSRTIPIGSDGTVAPAGVYDSLDGAVLVSAGYRFTCRAEVTLADAGLVHSDTVTVVASAWTSSVTLDSPREFRSNTVRIWTDAGDGGGSTLPPTGAPVGAPLILAAAMLAAGALLVALRPRGGTSARTGRAATAARRAP